MPKVMLDTLRHDDEILRLSELFVEKQHCLFLVVVRTSRSRWKVHSS